MCHVSRVVVAMGLVLAVASPATAATRYVKTSGAGNCSTWAAACTLGSALANAGGGDEIWVQGGTYGPITLKNGVKIIGGFAGTETTASQSNPTTNVSIIDGGGTSQAVSGSDNGASAVLRGFTVRNGLDSGSDGGGGIILNNSSALIVQCIFENNRAGDFGGAAGIRGVGSPQFINCIFRNNGLGTANPGNTKGGGAVFVDRGTPTFVNCLFYNNKAWEGGVVLMVLGAPTFINCTIVNNQATIGYGGVFFDPDGRATFRNCILRGNTTTRGVGYADQGYSGSGGTTTIGYSDVQGGWSGAGNIDADPLFNNPAGNDYKLQSTSPCKNAGQNAALPPDVGNLDWDLDSDEIIPMDLARGVRTQGTSVDMGAYEIENLQPPPNPEQPPLGPDE